MLFFLKTHLRSEGTCPSHSAASCCNHLPKLFQPSSDWKTHFLGRCVADVIGVEPHWVYVCPDPWSASALPSKGSLQWSVAQSRHAVVKRGQPHGELGTSPLSIFPRDFEVAPFSPLATKRVRRSGTSSSPVIEPMLASQLLSEAEKSMFSTPPCARYGELGPFHNTRFSGNKGDHEG